LAQDAQAAFAPKQGAARPGRTMIVQIHGLCTEIDRARAAEPDSGQVAVLQGAQRMRVSGAGVILRRPEFRPVEY